MAPPAATELEDDPEANSVAAGGATAPGDRCGYGGECHRTRVSPGRFSGAMAAPVFRWSHWRFTCSWACDRCARMVENKPHYLVITQSLLADHDLEIRERPSPAGLPRSTAAISASSEGSTAIYSIASPPAGDSAACVCRRRSRRDDMYTLAALRSRREEGRDADRRRRVGWLTWPPCV